MRVRLEGKDHFINRLGKFDDPVARARALAISAEIWSDFQQGDLDLSLNRYRPLVEGKDLDLIEAMRQLVEKTKQARVIHAIELWSGLDLLSRPPTRFGPLWSGCRRKDWQRLPSPRF